MLRSFQKISNKMMTEFQTSMSGLKFAISILNGTAETGRAISRSDRVIRANTLTGKQQKSAANKA
jgi:hypothetical protein